MEVSAEIKNTIAYKYALAVASGDLPVGNMIKLQVKRFFSWLDTAKDDGFYIDHKKGALAVNFFETCLNHTKGKMAGQPFKLAPFQQFTIYNIFSWIDKKTGLRRINTVYDKRAKKNGKSAEMAGLALFGMSFDNESGAEIYVGATKEEQAKICWKQAKDFIDHPTHKSKYLGAIGFKTLEKRILFTPLASVMSPLGGDSKTQDGINSHISIIDEYHGHKDDSVKENLESSSVQRSQPLTYHITTAGFNISGVCKNYEDTCKEILKGIKKDDTLWIMIHDIDDGDDWQDVKNWYKSNPLLGQGLTLASLQKEFNKAKNQASKIPNFKTKHLNMWVDAPDVWISDKNWMQNKSKVKLLNFIKYGCAGAIDLSTNIDLTAAAFISNPDADGVCDLIVMSFCPLDTIEKRSREDRVPYRFWMDLNYSDYIDFSGTDIKDLPSSINKELKILTATAGNMIDYNVVEDHTKKYYKLLRAKWIEYDRKFSDMLVHNFTEAGMEMHPFSQTIGMYSFPTKSFEALVMSGKLRHGGNPVLQWCLSGAVPIYDTNENVRISKSHSTKRIDPLIATIMAHAGNLTIDDSDASKYKDPEADVYF